MQQSHLIIFKDVAWVVRKGAYSYDRKLLKKASDEFDALRWSKG
jgi:hypothetical protein